MALSVDAWAKGVGERMPSNALRALLRTSLAGRNVALCLHRVAVAPRATDEQPYLTIPPDVLDKLIELLLSTREDAGQWLSVTFDDGYEDAARYVESRAARYPSVEFLLFVCPEKTDRQVGYRWDLAEVEGQRIADLPDDRLDVEAENAREELQKLARAPAFRLASADQLRGLQGFSNVFLGNHTNCHFKQTLLTESQAKSEYERSKGLFERQFGPQHHFAFPFGTPEHEFNASHVALLRAQGDFLIWSTEPRPYGPDERRPGGVLPRYPVNGTWGHRSIAAWIAARALLTRVRGPKASY